MTTHSSILVGIIPWKEKPGGLYSPWGHKESDTTETPEHIHIPFFFSFFSHAGHCRVLSRVPCAIQRSILVIYFIHITSCVYMSISISQFIPPPFYPGNHKFVFYIRDSLFCKFIYTLFLDTTYKGYQIFVFVLFHSV